MKENVLVIIPAFNEEGAIGKVIDDIPKELVSEIVVVNNHSTDNTASVATAKGATVLLETRKGYGYSCLKGIAYAKSKPVPPDIIVFLDGDYSDHPEELSLLLEPIIQNNNDLVIGSRVKGNKEKDSMMPQQVFGNWLATSLIKLLYNYSYSDLGPFRAIKYNRLVTLEMKDTTYGWTVEMQLKAAKNKFKICEVPVNYRKRIGTSKISGTVKGTILAGYKIITTIFRYL
jgi:glycosyltransferase involved in cell wall biosynthesis